MCPPHGEGRLSKGLSAMMPLLKIQMKPSLSKESKRVGGRLYSYVVTHDTGFSPNPFFGYCTLACCKPAIRRSAQVGDWIVGLTPKARGNRVVYFMRIDEVKDSFADYWIDRRFARKRPRYDRTIAMKCGDNIYEPKSDGTYRQLRSTHSDGEREDPAKKEHDLGGERVLISETFTYFGSEAIELPTALKSLVVGRAHKCHFTPTEKSSFIDFVSACGVKGVQAAPRRWSGGDNTWAKTLAGSCGH
jgi:hypothetical protein